MSWTIAELGERVESALVASGYQAPENGQVRAVPDLRTIRYYTTLGLLDRPVEMRGRTALYGSRHLHQLVAIKRLQADGLSLSEIQTRLTGLDDRALARIAKVEREKAEPPKRREGAFWAASPAPITSTPTSTTTSTSTSSRNETKIALAPGVYLVLEGDAIDRFAHALRSLGLVAEKKEGEP
ncbi:MAG TPA: MerR family transcriptional regulator [Kofleriaceae bacterium]|nr:MerR family transcriptional regulator [Kofleriaceae bacterium]